MNLGHRRTRVARDAVFDAQSAEAHAIATDDPDAWQVAADAWETAGDDERAADIRTRPARNAEAHAIATNTPVAWKAAANAWALVGDHHRAARLRDRNPRGRNLQREARQWFRAHGDNAQQAQRHAEGERYARRRGFVTIGLPEYDSYEDVYGEPPPPDTDFVTAILHDEDGAVLDSIGFVEDEPDRIRWWGAELAAIRMSSAHRGN